MEDLQQVYDIKEPPIEWEVEKDVLGMLLIDDKLIEDIVETVKRDCFFDDNHKDIWTAMLYLYHNNININVQTVVNRLQTKGAKEDLIEHALMLSTPSTARFQEKVDLLLDTYYKRAVYDLCLDITTRDIGGIASANLVKMVESGIERMGITSNIELDKFQDYIEEWVEQLESPAPVQKYKTGFKTLDESVLIEDSNLIIIASRPGLGKSALALNIVKNFCRQDKKVLFVSLEMSQKEIMNRLVSNIGKVKAQKVKRKEGLTPNDWASIMKAKEEIKGFKLNTYAKGSLHIEALVGLAKYLKKRGNLDILVVDYLQLLDSHNHSTHRAQQVSYISRKLKQIAMDLEIPVIALSQLNRSGVSDGSPREPLLSDLRESGSLEQDANVVIMLHTKDVNQEFQDERFLKLLIRKNRDGRLGRINYTYYGDFIEFVEKRYDTDSGQFVPSNYDVIGDV